MQLVEVAMARLVPFLMCDIQALMRFTRLAVRIMEVDLTDVFLSPFLSLLVVPLIFDVLRRRRSSRRTRAGSRHEPPV